MQFHNQDCLAAPEACMCAFFNEKNVPKDPKLKDILSSTILSMALAYIVVAVPAGSSSGGAQY